jgi:hypothetical protein
MPSAIAKKDRSRATTLIHDHEVGVPVAVRIKCRHNSWPISHGKLSTGAGDSHQECQQRWQL